MPGGFNLSIRCSPRYSSAVKTEQVSAGPSAAPWIPTRVVHPTWRTASGTKVELRYSVAR
jgi:hypothetical protein